MSKINSLTLAPSNDADGNVETSSPMPVLLTSRDVAHLLRVDSSTLSRWRTMGQGPNVVWLSPTTPRYRQSDVLAWLSRGVA